MNSLVDASGTIYVLLGIAAAALVAGWWVSNQLKYLFIALGVLALLLLLWLLVRFAPSDQRKLEDSVHAMADAVVKKNEAELFKHVSKDFRYKDLTRESLLEKAKAAMAHARVSDVSIPKFKVEELSREKKLAKTWFRVVVRAQDMSAPFMFDAQGDFVLEEEVWKLKTIRFYRFQTTEEFDPHIR
jgi:hypothetical protein